MKKITSYQTSDGETFTDRRAAHVHEVELTAMAKIVADCEPIFRAAPDVRRLLIAMLADPHTFIDALTPLAKARANAAKGEKTPLAAAA